MASIALLNYQRVLYMYIYIYIYIYIHIYICIYKVYLSGLNFREYPQKNMAQQHGTVQYLDVHILKTGRNTTAGRMVDD